MTQGQAAWAGRGGALWGGVRPALAWPFSSPDLCGEADGGAGLRHWIYTYIHGSAPCPRGHSSANVPAGETARATIRVAGVSTQGPPWKQGRSGKDQQSLTGSQGEVRRADWESRGVGPALIWRCLVTCSAAQFPPAWHSLSRGLRTKDAWSPGHTRCSGSLWVSVLAQRTGALDWLGFIVQAPSPSGAPRGHFHLRDRWQSLFSGAQPFEEFLSFGEETLLLLGYTLGLSQFGPEGTSRAEAIVPARGHWWLLDGASRVLEREKEGKATRLLSTNAFIPSFFCHRPCRRSCVPTHRHTQRDTNIYTQRDTHRHVHTHTNTHTEIHTCTHTCKHTSICTHIYVWVAYGVIEKIVAM